MAGDDETPEDPDRAAILARRRRFVALALTGLASSGCRTSAPEVCLRIAAPEAGEEPRDDGGEAEPSGLDGPIVEEPGAPLEPPPDDADDRGEPPEGDGGPASTKPRPRPCLNIVVPRPRPKPNVCLLMTD